MISDLIFIANEMKINAGKIDWKVPAPFPEDLARNYGGFRIQFSIDVLSETKKFEHLSVSKFDKSEMTTEELDNFKLVFFRKEDHVISFPGVV